jgi:DNA-binding MarR family transcriptional regulator
MIALVSVPLCLCVRRDLYLNSCLPNYWFPNYYGRMTSAKALRPKRKRRRFDTPEQEAYLNLWRTYDILRAIEDELFATFGLSAQQYNALRLLRGEHPGTLPTLALAGRLVTQAPDITRLLDKLEERGLIERQRLDSNRRVVQVGITTAGLSLLSELDDPVRQCGRKQLGHLPAADLARLTEILRSAREPHEDQINPWT